LKYFGTYAKTDGRFWLVKSTDHGGSWSEPIAVKARPNKAGWDGWSNNSVHGIQLTGGPRQGRLLIPAFLYKEGEEGEVPGVRGGVLFSDDHGSSWQVGGVLPPGSDEVTLAETGAGGVYANYRKNRPYHNRWRWHAWSKDGGESFSEQDSQPQELTTPVCHTGLARYSTEKDGPENILLFSNPAGSTRRVGRLTVRASYDEGRTWPVAKLIEEGPAGYSDLAVTADKTIVCLYEDSLDWSEEEIARWYDSFSSHDYVLDRRRPFCERISVARFSLEWLTER
jgi:sialidase-1